MTRSMLEQDSGGTVSVLCAVASTSGAYAVAETPAVPVASPKSKWKVTTPMATDASSSEFS